MQIMDLIYEKSGVRYYEVHIYPLLHQWRFSPKILQKKFINITATKGKKRFKKKE